MYLEALPMYLETLMMHLETLLMYLETLLMHLEATLSVNGIGSYATLQQYRTPLHYT